MDKKQIYIVDDDKSVCSALQCLLMTFGFAVSTFLSSDKFFGAVPDSAEGCLILDIHMQGMDGWETIKRMKASGSRRPVIIISADKNHELKEMALRAGAAGFLQKPFDAQALVDLISQTF